MKRETVSDLTLAVIAASGEVLRLHFSRLLDPCGHDFRAERQLAERLARGDLADLMDSAESEGRDRGFAHAAISSIFYGHLRPLLRETRDGRRARRGVDRHIWMADYDRRLKSLFPTGQGAARPHDEADASDTTRTRVSAVVQQSLIRHRRVVQMEKASTALTLAEAEYARLFAPSPYYIARRVLTDPDAPASEAYARAAIRTELLARVGAQYGPISLTYENVARALDDIHARVTTAKATRGVARASEPIFLRHYLAAKGLLSLEATWSQTQQNLRPDRLFEYEQNLLEGSRPERGPALGFRLHPDFTELPEPSDLLNELEGLPLPIEGAATIFHGGLRFSSGGDIVAAVSGPFGAGKTTTCLALAGALAPLGCRTLFLSCEEAADDIKARLSEAAPAHITRSTPLFRAVDLDDINDFGPTSPWFRAHKLRMGDVSTDHEEPIDVAGDLMRLMDEALTQSPLFEPFQAPEKVACLPAFARPVIIIDGFHQLFREADPGGRALEGSLRRLIDHCREQRAVFIFTVAEDEPTMHRLDYLCDLVLQLGRTGLKQSNEGSTRVFRVLKARRQPAIVGTHILHLAGPKGMRIKPNVASHVERHKLLRWSDPDPRSQVQLSDNFEELRVRERSQTLIYGKGSSGKAGLGLYILHRKPALGSRSRGDVMRASNLFDSPAPVINPEDEGTTTREVYEARTLVISFLYQASYYRNLAKRLRLRPRRDLKSWLPDRALIDVISLYPGDLRPEDFLAKIDNQMTGAELRGLPYTGILVDGIHNVFVQYPALEDETAFWPQLYTMLRRRGVSVVTTHTEFELRESGPHSKTLSVDFEHAQRKAAPLLSVLVSAADYVFELSAANDALNGWEYRLAARSTLGEDPPPGYMLWNRQTCRLGDYQG